MNDAVKETLPAKFDPTKWTERLKLDAEKQRKAERSTASFFSIKAAQLSFQGQAIKDNKMQVVVLESIHERTWYPQKYGMGDNTSPACYALSVDGKDTVPHPEATQPQATTCETCQWNKWGSSDNGKGKACREGRRVSLMSADDISNPDKILSAVTGYLRVPVTSAKNFGNYVQGVVGGTDLPLFCHITQVSVVPDAKTQVKVLFEHVRGIEDDAVLEALYNRSTAEAENIFFPYPKPEGGDEPAPAAAAAAAPAKPAKTRKY
jgi:hypothetical protein